MFRLLKRLGRRRAGLSTVGVGRLAVSSSRPVRGPQGRGSQSFSNFSNDVLGEPNWRAAGGCVHVGLGTGAVALCPSLGAEA